MIYQLNLYRFQSYAPISSIQIAADTDRLAEAAALAIFAYLQKQSKQTRRALLKHMSKEAIGQLQELLPMPRGFWAKMALAQDQPILIEDLSDGRPCIPDLENCNDTIHLKTQDLLGEFIPRNQPDKIRAELPKTDNLLKQATWRKNPQSFRRQIQKPKQLA